MRLKFFKNIIWLPCKQKFTSTKNYSFVNGKFEFLLQKNADENYLLTHFSILKRDSQFNV